jgi:hypothetical protein
VKRSQEVSKEFGRTVEAGYDTFVFKARQFELPIPTSGLM